MGNLYCEAEKNNNDENNVKRGDQFLEILKKKKLYRICNLVYCSNL